MAMVDGQEEVALTGELTAGNDDVGEFGPGAVDPAWRLDRLDH